MYLIIDILAIIAIFILIVLVIGAPDWHKWITTKTADMYVSNKDSAGYKYPFDGKITKSLVRRIIIERICKKCGKVEYRRMGEAMGWGNGPIPLRKLHMWASSWTITEHKSFVEVMEKNE